MRSRLFSAVALALLCAVTSLAQTSRGTVTGLVTDQNGSVVPAADVELKNSQTNQNRTTTTNDSGLYRFDAVDLGVYTLTIKAQGFKAISNTGLEVQANRISTINGELEVGTTEIVVEVSASGGELLQTSEAVRGGNFSTVQVTTLPTASLSAYDLGRLLPGVSTAQGSGASFGNGTSQFSVNGQRPRGNNYLLDGVENNDISIGGPAGEITNEDAVKEFSLQTGLFSAEFGRAGGGVFNVITKSGTNEFHGTARWLILSQRFNALTNNDRLSGLTKPAVFTENIFGGSIGGPIIKNKTFFFFAPQWDRFRSTANQGPFTVPTAAGVARLQALFAGNPRVATYLSAIGALRGVTSISNIALGPDPVTLVDRGSIEVGGIGFATPTISNDRQMVIRVDHNLSSRQLLSFRFTHEPSIFTPNLVNGPGFVSDFTGLNLNFLATHNWTISSSLTNEARVAFGRISFHFPLSPANNQLSL
ncbi:MAG TPA: carboxypeptidase regulatory-like domain-containing protein, partial [Pyrinomonadaceae bacterium]